MKQNSKTFLLLITILALVFGWILISPTPSQPTPDKSEFLYSESSPTTGSDNSPVKISVFSDYLCPYCENAHNEIKKMNEKYPEKIKVYYRNLIVHESSEILVRASLAANVQGKFEEMNDALFEREIESTEEAVEGLASDLGLNLDKFKQDLSSEQIDNIILQDDQDATNLNVRGTPTIYLNGIELKSFMELEAEVDKLMK